MHSARLLRLSTTAAVILAVAGCGSTPPGGSGKGQRATTAHPTTSTTSAPTSVSAMPSSYRYVCALVPVKAVQKALGRNDFAVAPGGAGNVVDRTDECRYTLRNDGDQARTVVRVGVGMTKVTPGGLAPSVKTAYGKQTPARELGPGAFIIAQPHSAYFLVNDRLVMVSAGMGSEVGTRAQLIATAKLFAAAVPLIEPAPAQITMPVCDPLEPLVTTALGGPVTVRRDSRDKDGLRCNFATGTTSAVTGVSVSPTAARDFANDSPANYDMAPIPGLTNAFYGKGQATALLSKTTTAGMTLFPVVPEEGKATALFKAVMQLRM